MNQPAAMDPDEASIRSTPWCAALLFQPNTTIIPTISRTTKPSTEDYFFGTTLKTPSTISSCLTFHTQPPSSTTLISPVHTLVRLEAGVNGYPHVAHGGIVTFLCDEIMGHMMLVNQAQRKDVLPVEAGGDIVTASLEVKFLRPVMTPQVVLVTASVGRVEGRKIFLEALITDSDGVALARSNAMWIAMRSPKEKL